MNINQIPIVFINLEQRKDRLEHILKQIADKEFIDTYRYDAHFVPKNGHLGCAESHLGAITYAQENNFDKVLILEDDFEFLESKEIVHEILNKIENIPKDIWDVIMFAQ